ncbi:class F sortase [Nocardia yamanashiensis]|uniref:class F sortase n=1 Tax=Nocardia yamanashiensis TaxID=209247 RepID=UPI001E47B3E5|nr:class F sortase [Nocardia yamanashiensis]UGT44902.1 class F sortase [Nocardia yamanashiensis]
MAAAILLIAGGALIDAAGPTRQPPPLSHSGPHAIGPLPAAPALPRSEPATLSIPALGLTADLDHIGMKPDGTVQDPVTFERPSWYDLGAAPGERGSAVILGHVDSYRGPAIFFRLGELRAGDAVAVTRADGATARFVVTRTETVPKDAFPAQSVYADHGDAELQLVTCGGDFDSARRTYRANVIVYTTLVRTSG